MKINHLQNKSLLPPKMMIKIKKVNKMKRMIKIMIWAMIKGELTKTKIKMIKTSQDHHHSLIQELGKLFNVSIWSTTFLVP
jgi:stress-induced morphogen